MTTLRENNEKLLKEREAADRNREEAEDRNRELEVKMRQLEAEAEEERKEAAAKLSEASRRVLDLEVIVEKEREKQTVIEVDPNLLSTSVDSGIDVTHIVNNILAEAGSNALSENVVVEQIYDVGQMENFEIFEIETIEIPSLFAPL